MASIIGMQMHFLDMVRVQEQHVFLCCYGVGRHMHICYDLGSVAAGGKC